jgi:hypothetical protein
MMSATRSEDHFTRQKGEAMSRWSIASILVGAGLVFGLSGRTTALADEKGAKEAEARPSQAQAQAQAGDDDPEKRVDKAIEKYESKADEDLEQTRKEIARSQKELSELFELNFSMAVSLAELQAELRVQSADNNAGGGDDSDSGKAKAAAQERQRIRTLELTRELRQVNDALRSMVQQKRNETDQFVAQLRALRAQQRQLASERERNRQSSSQDKD